MKNWKYIGWDGPEGLPCVLAFPAHAGLHKDFIPQGVFPRSAGFVSTVIVNGKVVFHVSGHSTSLKLAPRQEDSDAFNV